MRDSWHPECETLITSQLLECPDPRSSLTPSLAYFPGPCGSGEEEHVSASLHHRLTARQRESAPDSIPNLSPTSKLPPVNRLKHKAVNEIKSLIAVKFNVKGDFFSKLESFYTILYWNTQPGDLFSARVPHSLPLFIFRPSPQVLQGWNVDVCSQTVFAGSEKIPNQRPSGPA